MLTTYSFLPIAQMKLTQFKRPFKIILFSILHKTKNSISWCTNRQAILNDLSPPHIKNLLTLVPAPTISKVNAPSAIKEQLYKHLFPEVSHYPSLEISSLTNLKI